MGTPEGIKTDMQDMTEVISDAALRSSPPVAITVLGVNVQLPTIVYGLTILYIVAQLIVITPKVLRVIRGKHGKDKR